jgi:hypothetical protein
MVILELSDGEDERREINILSSLLSVLHYGETRSDRDESVMRV